MEWLQGNWYWLLFGGFFVWMHLSGRGCCSHGNNGKADECGNDSINTDVKGKLTTDGENKKSRGCCH